jgi:chemotaxis protein MotC
VKFKLLGVACALSFMTVGAIGEEVPTGFTGPSPMTSRMRQLFRFQDAVAVGDRNAVLGQKELISTIKKGQLTAKASHRPSNSDAYTMVGFVLSGGHPGLAEVMAETEGLDTNSKALLRGAAIYMRGNQKDARSAFKSIATVSLPPIVGGRVALVQAMLSDEGSAERQQHFGMAIALMPGTLIEESALRRSALSYADAGNQDRFWRRTERYFRRYGKSLYAPEFMSSVIDRILSFEKPGSHPELERVDRLLTRLPIPLRRTLYLELTRRFAAAGHAGLTLYAARRLRRLSVEGSLEELLALLYGSLFEAASVDPEIPLAVLAGIDRKRLPPTEQGLLDAAMTIARQIRQPADASIEGMQESVRAADGVEHQSALYVRARKALSEADETIAGGLR